MFYACCRNVSSVRHCVPSGYPSLMGFSFAWSVPENTVVSEFILGKPLVVDYPKFLHIFCFSVLFDQLRWTNGKILNWKE